MKTAASLYGSSLYDLAAEEHLTEDIREQLVMLEGIFKENPSYQALLLEPSIPRVERLKMIDEAFGGNVEPYVLNFLKILCENGLLRSFGECCRAYGERFDEDHGILRGTVVSAVALSEQQFSALTAKLSGETGKKVELTSRVDPAVLGGLRVELAGRMLDGSVAGHLSELRRKVNETVV